MSRPGVRHDGELEAGLHRGISSASSSGARHHGHRHHTPIPHVQWPNFWPASSPSLPPPSRFNTSLRPPVEVYPLVAAVAVGLGCAGILTWHDMRWNPEVLVRKDTRQLQVCTKEDDPSAFERLVNQSRKAYDHSIRRYVLGSKLWVFPGSRNASLGFHAATRPSTSTRKSGASPREKRKRAKKRKEKVKKRHSTRRETRRRARPPAARTSESARALTRVRIRGIRENEHA